MNESINDRFIRLKIDLAETENFIKSKGLYSQDLSSTIDNVLSNSFITCSKIILLAKNTILDMEDNK